MKPNRFPSRLLITTSLVFAAVTSAPTADAQAYCALRDPTTQIYQICPEASGFRSVVRAVDEAARDTITRRVPYPMHFTELGRHTLYIGLNGQRPVSLVQSRAERSQYGLIEVVWSFDMDLCVTGFTLQRCRARAADRAVIESEAFKKLVIGRSFQQLVELLTKDGKSLTKEGQGVVTSNPGLAVAVLRCGVKTLAAVEAVWGSDVDASRLWHHALGYFPQADNLLMLSTTPKAPTLSSLTIPIAKTGSAAPTQNIQGYAAQKDGKTVGVVSRTDSQFGPQSLSVWWGVDIDGSIMGITPNGKPDELTIESLHGLKGCSLDNINHSECSGPLQMVAAEMLTMATAYLDQTLSQTPLSGAE